MCELVHGPAPVPEAEAAHSCGNGHLGCFNPRHLLWKTHSANMADRDEHGTLLRGSGVKSAKLTEADVRSIYYDRRRQIEIAEAFGISQPTVSGIKRAKSWAWLTEGKR